MSSWSSFVELCWAVRCALTHCVDPNTAAHDGSIFGEARPLVVWSTHCWPSVGEREGPFAIAAVLKGTSGSRAEVRYDDSGALGGSGSLGQTAWQGETDSSDVARLSTLDDASGSGLQLGVLWLECGTVPVEGAPAGVEKEKGYS